MEKDQVLVQKTDQKIIRQVESYGVDSTILDAARKAFYKLHEMIMVSDTSGLRIELNIFVH